MAFGPVPSRRLGQSLGINNIPPKVCSYACPYCQAGKTAHLVTDRREFYPPRQIFDEVDARLQALREEKEQVDHLTFAPDGEPTLDINLGQEIDLLRGLDVPVSVITNGSLLSRPDVRAELTRADWVSVKVDAASESAWRLADRPNGQLDLKELQRGALDFAREFRGTLVTETMLMGGVNDTPEVARDIGRFLEELAPRKAFVTIPIRPPADEGVRVPSEAAVAAFVQTLLGHVAEVECLMQYEREPFGCTGDAERDILGVIAVHPMREESILELIRRSGREPSLIDDLVAQGRLLRVEHEGQTFYARPLAKRTRS
ncbi:MAG: radical SAM protein [Candidatus Wallbacteria bacterium]|nr:radical SAM protein [Candidatus Wallbacteria bacterium]